MSSDFKVSLMVLGDVGVGKTSLLLRFRKGTFNVYNPSTSISRYFKDIRVMNTSVKLELFDTGGQDRFREAVKGNYKKIDGVLLVYDVTDVTTFYKLSNWLNEFRSINEKANVMIVGNKCDNTEKKTVSQIMVKSYAFKENLEYYESSAKTGENVHKIFEQMTLKVLEAKNAISPMNSIEPYIATLPAPSTDSDTIKTTSPSVNISPEFFKHPEEPLNTSPEFFKQSEKPVNTSNKPAQLEVSNLNQPVHLTNELTQSEYPDLQDEPDWCFPDLEYLNYRHQDPMMIENSSPKKDNTDLPPIVPLPDDTILLHTETLRKDGRRRKNQCC